MDLLYASAYRRCPNDRPATRLDQGGTDCTPNASMGAIHTQSLNPILINALHTSYEVLASTILASGAPTCLTTPRDYLMLLMRKDAGPATPDLPYTAKTASINANGKDQFNLTCHHCNRKGK